MCKYNYGCHCCGFSKCAKMWKHAIVHRGLETVRESALEGGSVKIILRCSGVSKIVDRFYVALFFAIEQTHCAILRYRTDSLRYSSLSSRLTALFFAIEQTHCAIVVCDSGSVIAAFYCTCVFSYPPKWCTYKAV